MTDVLFGPYPGYAALVCQIRWQVHNILDWLPAWLAHIGSLNWDDWMHVDLDLQRLFVLLDYEHPGHWQARILCNAKYTAWPGACPAGRAPRPVAKLVVFCLRQWQHFEECVEEEKEDNG